MNNDLDTRRALDVILTLALVILATQIGSFTLILMALRYWK